MRRYALLIEFDGIRYHGWQIQYGVPTVQEFLEKAAYQMTGEKVRVVGAGRTDAGVHARGQVAHFTVTEANHPSDVYVRGLNSYLPDDILILDCAETDLDFHARYDAFRRSYIYEITRRPVALNRNYLWFYQSDLDNDMLDEAAKHVVGEKDFTSFMHAQSETENTICVIEESSWEKQGELLRYHIIGNRFLHNMVRCLVGTMAEVARGRYTVDEFIDFIEHPDKEAPVYRAPAHGLYLNAVEYHQALFETMPSRERSRI